MKPLIKKKPKKAAKKKSNPQRAKTLRVRRSAKIGRKGIQVVYVAPEPDPKPRERRFRCENCFQLTRESDLLDLAYSLRCPRCRKLFYVLAVEPGADEAVKRLLNQESKLQNIHHFFGKIIVPKEFTVKVSKDKYTAYDQDDKEIGTVTAESQEEALYKARSTFHYNKKRDRGDPNDPAIREMKARTIMRTELQLEGGDRKLQRYRCYSGYLIVQMEFNDTTRVFLDSLKMKGAWGLLPLKPQLYGFRYPRKEPKERTKPKKWEKEKHEEWIPTPCKDEEAAMIMIRQAAIKQGPEIVAKNYKIGDKVKVKEGTFMYQEGPILEVKGPESDPTLKIEITILGRRVPVDVNHSQVEKL